MQLTGSKFCPFYRAVRILLKEHLCDYESNDDVTKLHWPVLTDNERSLRGFLAIGEWITRFDTGKDMDRLWDFALLTELWSGGASVIIAHRILRHKINGIEYPDIVALRQGRAKFNQSIKDINEYLKDHNYLGMQFGTADALLASIVSFLDYVDEVMWFDNRGWLVYPDLAKWYMSIKGRPSFRFILNDSITGLHPPVHYSQIDFI